MKFQRRCFSRKHMKNFIFKILLTSSLVVVACAPKVNFKDPQKSDFTGFGPTTQDRQVNLLNSTNLDSVLNLSNHSNQDPWIDNSSDIFRFSEETLSYETNDADKKVLDQLGHKILLNYYSNKQNTTQFDATTSSYLEAAIAFEGPHIYSFFKNIV